MNRPNLEPLTPARHYLALLDSVDIVSQLCEFDVLDPLQVETIRRNVEHMEHVLGWDIWTDEDMTPVESAISRGHSVLSSLT